MTRSSVIRRALAILLVAGGLTLGGAAMGRSADYSGGGSALILAGQELKVDPLTTTLAPKIAIASVKVVPSADHETLKLGLYCAAYKVENSVSVLMPAIEEEWNKALEATHMPSGLAAEIEVQSASSYRRCVELSEMNVRCITRVKLAGTARAAGNGTSAVVQVSADVERNSSVGGFCSSLARGVAVTSREAALALFNDAQAKLTTPPAP